MSQVERDSGWLSGGMVGPIAPQGAPPAGPWPAETRAFELVILGQDEQRRPLTESFRQLQLRHLIPEAIAALTEGSDEVVVRLDGPLTDGELLAAFRRLTDPAGNGRFAFAPAQKLAAAPLAVMGSVRLVLPLKPLAALCADSSLGLERAVRLRAFSMPPALVSDALELDSVTDVLWGEILTRAGFYLGTTRGLRSLQILTSRHDAAAVKAKVMKRLIAAASATGQGPAV